MFTPPLPTMALLQESLNKFNKQRVRCLTAIATAAKATALTSTTKPTPSNETNVKPPAVKFSNDTERLQIINSMKNSPVGSQIKRVIDLLFETRHSLTPEEINEACYVQLKENKSVLDSLKNNPKVHYDGECFSYKSKHALKNKEELLILIRKFREGVAIMDLKDSYPTVVEDLQALKASGQVWLLSNFDSQEDIVYPNDPRINTIKVDDDLKLLFRETKLHDMLDIEKELQRNGIKPSTNTAKRRATSHMLGVPQKPKTKVKKRRRVNIGKSTNPHLPELLKD
ncbi:hypothetical protein Leryth_002219 [Lithospermum erythrorhizon]|nr:hypothetical protein Leryth_002219 [Lithospermum erythrorhizon]